MGKHSNDKPKMWMPTIDRMHTQKPSASKEMTEKELAKAKMKRQQQKRSRKSNRGK